MHHCRTTTVGPRIPCILHVGPQRRRIVCLDAGVILRLLVVAPDGSVRLSVPCTPPLFPSLPPHRTAPHPIYLFCAGASVATRHSDITDAATLAADRAAAVSSESTSTTTRAGAAAATVAAVAAVAAGTARDRDGCLHPAVNPLRTLCDAYGIETKPTG